MEGSPSAKEMGNFMECLVREPIGHFEREAASLFWKWRLLCDAGILRGFLYRLTTADSRRIVR
jgi:hypothetical protein